jgi:hypothetical protein
MRRDDLYLDDALTAVRELGAFMATTTEAEYHADSNRHPQFPGGRDPQEML